MSRIPDCREDEYYNEKYLNEMDKAFIRGYDWAVACILNLFENLETYPEAEEILSSRVLSLAEDKPKIMQDAVRGWSEMDRNELITSMIDSMDDDGGCKE